MKKVVFIMHQFKIIEAVSSTINPMEKSVQEMSLAVFYNCFCETFNILGGYFRRHPAAAGNDDFASVIQILDKTFNFLLYLKGRAPGKNIPRRDIS